MPSGSCNMITGVLVAEFVCIDDEVGLVVWGRDMV